MCLRNFASPVSENTAFAGSPTVYSSHASMTVVHATSFLSWKYGFYAPASANLGSPGTSHLRRQFMFPSRCNNGTYSPVHNHLVHGVEWHPTPVPQRIGRGVWGVGFVWVRFCEANRGFESARAEDWVRFAFFFVGFAGVGGAAARS
jgi:hypothetical protein